MYVKGEGVSQDYEQGAKYFKLSAEQGTADALYNLGLMYRDGLGVPQDSVEAERYFKLAGDQGYTGK